MKDAGGELSRIAILSFIGGRWLAGICLRDGEGRAADSSVAAQFRAPPGHGLRTLAGALIAYGYRLGSGGSSVASRSQAAWSRSEINGAACTQRLDLLRSIGAPQ